MYEQLMGAKQLLLQGCCFLWSSLLRKHTTHTFAPSAPLRFCSASLFAPSILHLSASSWGLRKHLNYHPCPHKQQHAGVPERGRARAADRTTSAESTSAPC